MMLKTLNFWGTSISPQYGRQMNNLKSRIWLLEIQFLTSEAHLKTFSQRKTFFFFVFGDRSGIGDPGEKTMPHLKWFEDFDIFSRFDWKTRVLSQDSWLAWLSQVDLLDAFRRKTHCKPLVWIQDHFERLKSLFRSCQIEGAGQTLFKLNEARVLVGFKLRVQSL